LFNDPLMSVTAAPGSNARADIVLLCAAWAASKLSYDGWRSPWDQDEIMVCPHAIVKLQIANKPAGPTAMATLDHGTFWTCLTANLRGAYHAKTAIVALFGEAGTTLPTSHPGAKLGGAFACLDGRAYITASNNMDGATILNILNAWNGNGKTKSVVWQAYPHATTPRAIPDFSFHYSMTSIGTWNPWISADEHFPTVSSAAAKTFGKLSCTSTVV